MFAKLLHSITGGSIEPSTADLARTATEAYEVFCGTMAKLTDRMAAQKADMETQRNDMVDAHKYLTKTTPTGT